MRWFLLAVVLLLWLAGCAGGLVKLWRPRHDGLRWEGALDILVISLAFIALTWDLLR